MILAPEQLSEQELVPHLEIDRTVFRCAFFVFGGPVLFFVGGFTWQVVSKVLMNPASVPNDGWGVIVFFSPTLLVPLYILSFWLSPAPRPGGVQRSSVLAELITAIAALGIMLLADSILVGMLIALLSDVSTLGFSIIGRFLFFLICGPMLYYVTTKVLKHTRKRWKRYRTEGVTTATFSKLSYVPGEQGLVRIERTEEPDPDMTLTLHLQLVDEAEVEQPKQRNILYAEKWTATYGRASDGIRFTIPAIVEGQRVTAEYRKFDEPRYWELLVEFGDNHLHQFIVDVQ